MERQYTEEQSDRIPEGNKAKELTLTKPDKPELRLHWDKKNDNNVNKRIIAKNLAKLKLEGLINL